MFQRNSFWDMQNKQYHFRTCFFVWFSCLEMFLWPFRNWRRFSTGWTSHWGDEVEALPSQILSTWHCLHLRESATAGNCPLEGSVFWERRWWEHRKCDCVWYRMCIYYIYIYLVGGLEHEFYFPINIGCLSSSQLTNSNLFQRAGQKPPTRFIFIYIRKSTEEEHPARKELRWGKKWRPCGREMAEGTIGLALEHASDVFSQHVTRTLMRFEYIWCIGHKTQWIHLVGGLVAIFYVPINIGFIIIPIDEL